MRPYYENEALKNVSKARARILTKHPFFGMGLLKLKLVADSSIPSITTDGVTLKVNPEWFDALPAKQKTGVLIHEWCHIMFKHHIRRQDRDHLRWNISADYAVNIFMHDCESEQDNNISMELPEGALLDFKYRDMTAEAIYNKLPEQPSSEDQKGSEGTGEIEDHPELNPGTEPGGDPVDDDDDDDRREELEAEVDREIQSHAMSAEMAGKLPGNIAREVDRITRSLVDWKAELASFMQQTAKEDYSYSRRNTRMARSPFFLPSLYNKKVGCIALAVDTSGSVSKEELRSFTSEVLSIFDSIKPETLHVIWCDTRVQSVQSLDQGDEINLEPVGGGGTNFEPPFRWLDDNDEYPECLIYLTDGYCRRFADEPDYPVLWVLTEENIGFDPPYGVVIQTDMGE